MFSGLSVVNVEISSVCNKRCWHCHRRVVEKKYSRIAESYGFMPWDLLSNIAKQLPDDIVVQLHNSGEPLMYPNFDKVSKLFYRQILNVVTNGKLLLEKSALIVGRLDTLCVSVFQDDPEQDEQYDILCAFVKRKGNARPLVTIKLEGDLDSKKYDKLGVVTTRRLFKEGTKKGAVLYGLPHPMVPEFGICRDLLNHLCINKDGDVSVCVRFDPAHKGVLGNVKSSRLSALWGGILRKDWLKKHCGGLRDEVPLCAGCEYYGIPVGE